MSDSNKRCRRFFSGRERGAKGRQSDHGERASSKTQDDHQQLANSNSTTSSLSLASTSFVHLKRRYLRIGESLKTALGMARQPLLDCADELELDERDELQARRPSERLRHSKTTGEQAAAMAAAHELASKSAAAAAKR